MHFFHTNLDAKQVISFFHHVCQPPDGQLALTSKVITSRIIEPILFPQMAILNILLKLKLQNIWALTMVPTPLPLFNGLIMSYVYVIITDKALLTSLSLVDVKMIDDFWSKTATLVNSGQPQNWMVSPYILPPGQVTLMASIIIFNY